MIDLSNATHSPKGEFCYSRLSSFPKGEFCYSRFSSNSYSTPIRVCSEAGVSVIKVLP